MLRVRGETRADVTVLHCMGRITAGEACATLRESVLHYAETEIVVLDLAEVTAIDAAGIGALLSIRSWARAMGKKLKLQNLTPPVKHILELTHLATAFEVYSSAESEVGKASSMGLVSPVAGFR